MSDSTSTHDLGECEGRILAKQNLYMRAAAAEMHTLIQMIPLVGEPEEVRYQVLQEIKKYEKGHE